MVLIYDAWLESRYVSPTPVTVELIKIMRSKNITYKQNQKKKTLQTRSKKTFQGAEVTTYRINISRFMTHFT